MKIKDLNKEELQEVTDMYIKERDMMGWLCSLEEYCESYVRKCESCGELVYLWDGNEDLPVGTNYRGEKYRSCPECYKESKEYEGEEHETYY